MSASMYHINRSTHLKIVIVGSTAAMIVVAIAANVRSHELVPADRKDRARGRCDAAATPADHTAADGTYERICVPRRRGKGRTISELTGRPPARAQPFNVTST